MSLNNALQTGFAKQLLDAQAKITYRNRAVELILMYLINNGYEFEELHAIIVAARMANDLTGNMELIPDEEKARIKLLCRMLYAD